MPALWGAVAFGFVLIPMHPVSSQRKGGCTGSWHVHSFLAVCIQAHLHQEQGPAPRCRHDDCESSPELPHVSEKRSFANTEALHSTHCCPPQHWETLRVMYTEAIPAPGKTGQTTGKRWHEKVKGLLLKVVGRAENFPLSTGLAFKPFSLLLSADVLQRCKT